MDNHGMDDHDLDIKRLDDPKWKLLLENPKVRILGALAIGLVLGSGATWGMLRTDQPKSSRATIMEQRKADPKIKAQSNGSARSVKQTTSSKKSKSPVKVAKKDTKKKKPVTSASAKKKSTKKTATASKAKPATKTTTTAKSTKKKKRSTTAKPANASTKPASKPATSTSNTSAVKPLVVDSNSAQPVTTARIHTMVPE